MHDSNDTVVAACVVIVEVVDVLQEHYLSWELELVLDRMESPAWNLTPHTEQAALVQPPPTRVPAAYQPKVTVACSDDFGQCDETASAVLRQSQDLQW